MKPLVLSTFTLGLFLVPVASSAQSVPNPTSSSVSAPSSPYPQGYPSYAPINNNGGIISGVGGGSTNCGSSISAEIGYGNSGGNNTIYSGSSSGGFDTGNNLKSDVNGKFVFNYSFNPCFSGKEQMEMQSKENCAVRRDQFIAQNPLMPIAELDLRLARFCGAGK
jgi:hypothetical protein